MIVDPSTEEYRTIELGKRIATENDFVTLGNSAYFVELDDDGKSSIWLTDGRSNEATLVAAKDEWQARDRRRNLSVSNDGALSFVVPSGNDIEVWIHEQEETRLLNTLPELKLNSVSTAAVGDKLSVFATNLAGEQHLWIGNQDGTTALELTGNYEPPIFFGNGVAIRDANTRKYLVSKDATSESLQELELGKDLFQHDGLLFYRTSNAGGLAQYDDLHNDTLWQTDGTREGTRVVADLSAYAVEHQQFLGVVDGQLFFAGEDLEHGTELWKLKIEPKLVGDLDLDGEVNFEDFLRFSRSFGKTFDVAYSDGDVDGDGHVSFLDFLAISANFGKRDADGM